MFTMFHCIASSAIPWELVRFGVSTTTVDKVAEKKITLEAGTPEAVAYLLFQGVAKAEEQRFTTDGTVVADRKWLLDTYAECLLAVTQPQMR